MSLSHVDFMYEIQPQSNETNILQMQWHLCILVNANDFRVMGEENTVTVAAIDANILGAPVLEFSRQCGIFGAGALSCMLLVFHPAWVNED